MPTVSILRVSTTGRRGYEYYNKLGYVPYDVKINESAARTLEYAYDDWCIYRMGEKLGRPAEELEVYKKRSQNYRNLFDPKTKLMRGKNVDGTFQSPFNPFKWGEPLPKEIAGTIPGRCSMTYKDWST